MTYTDEEPICAHCQHRIEQAQLLGGVTFFCGRFEQQEKPSVDPVTGAVTIQTFGIVDCREERSYGRHREDLPPRERCGPQGRYFEPGARKRLVDPYRFFGRAAR